jgi:hypothetical protein
MRAGKPPLDRKSLARYRRGALELDPLAEFIESTKKWSIRHSVCNEVKDMKQPGDLGHFKTHIRKCRPSKGQKNNQRVDLMFRHISSKATETPSTAGTSNRLKMKLTSSNTSETVQFGGVQMPCIGFQDMHNRIPRYLERNGSGGGGSRSKTVVAAQYYNCAYTSLTPAQKANVDLVREKERRWINLHERTAIISTKCLGFVDAQAQSRVCDECAKLQHNESLRKALDRDVPAPENVKFNNIPYRPSVLLGRNFLNSMELGVILDSVSDQVYKWATEYN